MVFFCFCIIKGVLCVLEQLDMSAFWHLAFIKLFQKYFVYSHSFSEMFKTNLHINHNILYFDYIIFQPIHQTQLIFDKDFGIWMLRTYMFLCEIDAFLFWDERVVYRVDWCFRPRLSIVQKNCLQTACYVCWYQKTGLLYQLYHR